MTVHSDDLVAFRAAVTDASGPEAAAWGIAYALLKVAQAQFGLCETIAALGPSEHFNGLPGPLEKLARNAGAIADAIDNVADVIRTTPPAERERVA